MQVNGKTKRILSASNRFCEIAVAVAAVKIIIICYYVSFELVVWAISAYSGEKLIFCWTIYFFSLFVECG